MNIGHWVRRAWLNLRGFLAATLATVLPGAAPFVRKLLASYLAKGALVLNTWLGLQYDWSNEIILLTDAVIALLGAFAVYRAPNEQPTAIDKANPVVRTATEIPPR